MAYTDFGPMPPWLQAEAPAGPMPGMPGGMHMMPDGSMMPGAMHDDMGGMAGMMAGMPMPPPMPPPQPEAPADPFMGLDPEALFVKFKDWWDNDSTHAHDWRDEAEKDFAYSALDQWSEADREKLAAEMRAPIVFDCIGPILEAVVGQQVSNRQESRYIPREPGDTQVNELLTGAGEWFKDQADAESEETAAFKDALICGVGWIETGLDYEINPEGDPRVERIDPLEMFADCSSRKTNYLDARRVWRVKKVPLSDAEQMFPDYTPSELDAAWASYDEVDNTRSDGGPRYYETSEARDIEEYGKDSYVTLVEIQWWEKEVFYRTFDPLQGQEVQLTQDEHESLMERSEQIAMMTGAFVRPGVKQFRRVYRKAFIGSKVLEVTPTLDPERFNYQAITAYRDRNKGVWFGLIRKMRDPQQWTNKWLSQTLHILNSQAGAGLMMEGEQREDPDEFDAEWAKPNSVVKFASGALTSGKVQPKPMPQLPEGYFRLLEWASAAPRTASGVNLEQLGLREAVQPGVLEYQRRQSGVQVLAGLFDSLRRFHYEQARLILCIIQNNLSDGRLIRIGGDQVESIVHLTRDKTIGEYDVIVDDAPSAPNQKEAVWQMVIAMLPYFGDAMISNPQVMLALLKYSPFPSSLVADIEQAIAPAEPTPEEQEMQALQMQQQREMVRSMSAEASKDEAQAINYQAQAAYNQAKSAQEMNVDLAQAEHYRALAELHYAQARQAMMPKVVVQPSRPPFGASQRPQQPRQSGFPTPGRQQQPPARFPMGMNRQR